MRAHAWRLGLAGALALIALAVGWGMLAVGAAVEAPPAARLFQAAGTPAPLRLALRPDAEAPAISAIDAPSPTCYCPVKNTGRCYLQWQ